MKPADSAPVTFREFEHRAWQRVVKLYEDYFGALTAQSIGPLLDAVNVHTGAALLDIATGPGYIAAAAARRGAKVTGLDFSSAAAFFDGISASTVRTAALLRAQTPGKLAKIRAAAESEARNYSIANGTIELPMPALLASARKP